MQWGTSDSTDFWNAVATIFWHRDWAEQLGAIICCYTSAAKDVVVTANPD